MCGVRGLWEGRPHGDCPGSSLWCVLCRAFLFFLIMFSLLTSPTFTHRGQQDREVHIKRTNAHRYLPGS
ncbi:hypothetical protein PanWU01x14_100930 [Parasponia andersonii]|uniref:Transmembrane protein n=1 Tax=Parasponia andersonii TaxID=3476 RepID=A0A2P5D2Z2_PARAD|nr:hypothetical protein PanWU01x14_100930 [Parasponia andersonii]